MSTAQEIASILAGAASKSDKEVTECIKLAKCEVEKLIKASGQTLKSVCAEIEDASTKEALAAAFRKLNSFTRIFVDMALVGKHGVRIRDALLSLQVSERLEAILRTAVSVHEALLGYKKAVVEDLAIAIRLKESVLRKEYERDAELLALLPSPVSPVSEVDTGLEPAVEKDLSLEVGSKSAQKRDSSGLLSHERSSKKPRRPVLASVQQVVDEEGAGASSLKRTLFTREKLRAGEHDPKGLLDLVSTSTSALEHTKKLELLKAAGYILTSKNNASEAEKFNAATVRLELGLGGQSVSDTVLFGTNVLSTAGVLSKKNIQDIENNYV